MFLHVKEVICERNSKHEGLADIQLFSCNVILRFKKPIYFPPVPDGNFALTLLNGKVGALTLPAFYVAKCVTGTSIRSC